MLDQSRIDDLRRRIDLDPTSIAFAELAEAYRREGKHAEAVRLCRAGLARHPAYLSARVTLGRALTALGDLPSAQAELEQVLRVAHSSLPALRALAEVHRQRDEPEVARDLLEKASTVAQEGLDLEEPSAEIARHLADAESPSGAPASLEPAAETEPEPAPEPEPGPPSVAAPDEHPDAPSAPVLEPAAERSPELQALERFLARIESASRRGQAGEPLA